MQKLFLVHIQATLETVAFSFLSLLSSFNLESQSNEKFSSAKKEQKFLFFIQKFFTWKAAFRHDLLIPSFSNLKLSSNIDFGLSNSFSKISIIMITLPFGRFPSVSTSVPRFAVVFGRLLPQHFASPLSFSRGCIFPARSQTNVRSRKPCFGSASVKCKRCLKWKYSL